MRMGPAAGIAISAQQAGLELRRRLGFRVWGLGFRVLTLLVWSK